MNEAPTTQERYSTAIQSSSLRVNGEHVPGDADYLIAAGWCKSRFGAALMRLQAEWDGAERWGVRLPVKPTKRAIITEAQVKFETGTEKRNGKDREVQVRKITKQSMEAARVKLEKRYENELAKVMRALKSLPEVAKGLQTKLVLEGQTIDMAAPLLLHWLDPVCKVCQGQKYQLAPCKTKLSGRACGCCNGVGVAKAPGGDVGRDAMEFLDSCLSRAGREVRTACRC